MIWYFVVGINVIAVIIFIFLVLHYKKKWEGIKHYEKVRDKLTVREEEPEEVEDEGGFSSSGLLRNLIGGFIVILVGINVISAVTDEVNLANQTMNVTTELTSASTTIINLVSMFFALGITVAGISLAYGGLRNAGLLGDYEEPKKKPNKNKRNGIKHYEGVRDKVTKR